MYYNSELGIQGNIERSLRENQLQRNDIYNECTQRIQQDTDNRVALEQQATESYLDLVQAQQDITSLQLQILEMGGK